MGEYANDMAWGAGAGVVFGLASAWWGTRDWQGVLMFGIVGAVCAAMFLFGLYIGDPHSRAMGKLAVVAPMFLAASAVTALAKPFLRRPPRRRPPKSSE